MVTLTDLQHRLGFTRNEVTLILFLSFGLLAGAGIRHFRAGAPGPSEIPPSSAYAASDSEFAARSVAADADTLCAGSSPQGGKSARKPRLASASIDINTATPAQLVRLPGIGEAYAGRIVAYRDGHGRFSRIEDLMHVSGIGPKKFQTLRPFVTVR